MAASPLIWKKGRGKLGPFKPLLGTWRHTGESEMGTVTCVRTFAPALDGAYIQLTADWVIGDPKTAKRYSELCLFGPHKEHGLGFWSFTSDGKRSAGWLSAAGEVHATALCFEADMDMGRARQLYWPHPDEGFQWAVESRTKKGWNRFTAHHYTTTE